MSKRLKNIPTSCPMFDKAIAELEYIERLVEKDVWEDIKKSISTAIDCIEEGRTVNGDLRDTCSDIADTKDKEIAELEDRYSDEIKDLNSTITHLQDKVEELEGEISFGKEE